MPIDDNFYRAFEEEFRGSEEDIKNRLSFYAPLLKVYAKAYPSSKPSALDIGCGRGEMLSLYKDFDFEAFGIDINKNVLEYAKSKGFEVTYSDALDFLKAKEENTYDVVSLIHVLEHLSFEYAFELYEEALRVLKPGGSFIVEFPFAENLLMGSIDFWLDPTHLKPIHPKMVKFVWEYIGFDEVSYFGINGIYKPLKDISFQDVISYHVAPNAAIIGIKPTQNVFFLEELKSSIKELKERSSYRLQTILDTASKNLNDKFNELYQAIASQNDNIKKETDDKIDRFTKDLNNKFNELYQAIASQNDNIKKETDDKIDRFTKDLNNKFNELYQAIASQNERLNQLNGLILYVKSQNEMLTSSKPWKIYSLLGKIKGKIFSLFKSHPTPISSQARQEQNETPISSSQARQEQNEEPSNLTLRARKIYHMLKEAINKKE